MDYLELLPRETLGRWCSWRSRPGMSSLQVLVHVLTLSFYLPSPLLPFSPQHLSNISPLPTNLQSARPSRKDLANRQSIITRLQNLISSNWPQDNLQVSSFGSSLTGLSTTTSDLDLVLLDPSHSRGIGTPPNQVRFRRSDVVMIDGRPEWESVGVLSRLLSRKGKQYGFAAIQKIAHASIPIVKFIDQSTGIHVDLNCNDRFGIANSKLISTYAQIRESLVKPLMYFIKFWSKAKDLNDPTGRKGPGGATFSSYSLCLMVIHYLQQDFQLPYLQSKDALARCGITKENHNQEYAYLRPPKKRFARDREREERQRNSIPSTVCDLSFAQDISQFEEYLELEGEDNQSRRDVELGKHTLGFFEYFAKFDRKKFGVSILYRTLELKPKDRIKNDDATSSSAQDLTEKLQSLDVNSTRELSFRARNPEQYSASSGDPAPAPNLPGLGGNPDTVFPPQTQEWMDTSWVTQDPLILTRNTSRALHEPSSIRFETELKLAIESIRLGEWISVVCEDVRIKKLEVLENQKHAV